MTDIYDQHAKAFARVEAYTVSKDGKQVASIAFKFPADGAGRLYAYIHWFGTQMVRGSANGYGYDKWTAACASATAHLEKRDPDKMRLSNADLNDLDSFIVALAKDEGASWERQLRDTGFDVWQAV